jgi:glycosyltransferase A (GT-A) superfamily protein (DUF2064 family)
MKDSVETAAASIAKATLDRTRQQEADQYILQAIKDATESTDKNLVKNLQME